MPRRARESSPPPPVAATTTSPRPSAGRSIYEDVTVDVQPDPARHLLQGWIYGVRRRHRRLPAGMDGAEVLQLARVPRSQRGVGADDLSQQRERRPADQPEPRQRQGGARVRRAGTAAGSRSSRSHVSAWAHAEHGIGMHVYLPAQRDAPTNMINNALSVASAHKLRFGQDLILYNLELTDQIEGFDGTAHKEAWANDPVWQGVRENVERLTGDPRLGGGVLRRHGRVRAARRRAVPQRVRDAGRGAAGRLRHPDADGRRRVRRRARPARVARGCSGCSPTTSSSARRTGRRCSRGSTRGRRSASPPPGRCSRSGHSRARR